MEADIAQRQLILSHDLCEIIYTGLRFEFFLNSPNRTKAVIIGLLNWQSESTCGCCRSAEGPSTWLQANTNIGIVTQTAVHDT